MERDVIRSSVIVACFAVLAVAGSAVAQEVKTPSAKVAETSTAAMTGMKTEMAQMDEHIKAMQALHQELMSASTAEERQQLMDEQRKEMQGCMTMMTPATQADAAMGHASTGMMMHTGKPADTHAQMQMMQKRMDMMQSMMQAMMDEHRMMTAPGSLDIKPRN